VGNAGKFVSGASVIYLGLVTSSLSYWTCQRSANVAMDSLTHPIVFLHLCHILTLKLETSKPKRCSEVPQWLRTEVAVRSKGISLECTLPWALAFRGARVVPTFVLILGVVSGCGGSV